MKKPIHILMSFYLSCNVYAQDSLSVEKKLSLNGFINYLKTTETDKHFNSTTYGNLIHNRINIKWKPTTKIKAVAEIRNRIFWGEMIKSTPYFSTLLKNENELLNLRKVLINNNSIVLHTNIERLYFDFADKNWSVRIGRQRINWGMTTTWNPNDIFNTYNFLDFDYEERTGMDGIDIYYKNKESFNIELSYANAGKKNGNVAAIKYGLNKWNYDFQLITGWYHEQPTFGVGWAGNIDKYGFKGEIQYFLPIKDSIQNLNIKIEFDQIFKNNWYVNAGVLISNQGIDYPIKNWDSINFKSTPKILTPNKWNLTISVIKEISPLWSYQIGCIYSPGTNMLVLYPSSQYEIYKNLVASLVWQSFYTETDSIFMLFKNNFLFRIKWNF